MRVNWCHVKEVINKAVKAVWFCYCTLQKYPNWVSCVPAKSPESCLTLCNPMDYSPPGSSVHRTLQSRILEWVAMPSSKRSSWLKDWTFVSFTSCIGSCILTQLSHLGSPWRIIFGINLWWMWWGEDNFWDVSNVFSLFLFWEQNFFITEAYIYRRNFLNVYLKL